MPNKPVTKAVAAALPTPAMAWSFSRWHQYEQCPQQFNFKHLRKLPAPDDEGPALVRGKQIHAEAESYVDKPSMPLPDNLRLLAGPFKALRELGGASELQKAFNAKWEETGWFDKETSKTGAAWCRVVIDRIVYATPKTKTVRIIDYKSGKIRGEYVEQVELYQLSGLLLDPIADSATGELWFTDQGKILGGGPKGEIVAVPRSAVPKLKKKWEARIKPMMNDKVFAPKPGNHCRFCHWSKAKGGPCVY